jgi:hypothetical protein
MIPHDRLSLFFLSSPAGLVKDGEISYTISRSFHPESVGPVIGATETATLLEAD